MACVPACLVLLLLGGAHAMPFQGTGDGGGKFPPVIAADCEDSWVSQRVSMDIGVSKETSLEMNKSPVSYYILQRTKFRPQKIW